MGKLVNDVIFINELKFEIDVMFNLEWSEYLLLLLCSFCICFSGRGLNQVSQRRKRRRWRRGRRIRTLICPSVLKQLSLYSCKESLSNALLSMLWLSCSVLFLLSLNFEICVAGKSLGKLLRRQILILKMLRG